ncbi:MAG: DUF2283 domain-containing protein [Candidatus Manganitrophaceae bacterium]
MRRRESETTGCFCFDRLSDGCAQERRCDMAKKVVKLWYDSEGDHLEVIFEQKEGYFRATENDHVMEKVDQEGNVLGFSVFQVSKAGKKPLEVALT